MKRAANMNIRTFILSSTLLVGAPLFARENTDVLVMKNGDRMTCQGKGLDAGVLYVSFDYMDGTTSVQWSKVARLESKRQPSGIEHKKSLCCVSPNAALSHAKFKRSLSPETRNLTFIKKHQVADDPSINEIRWGETTDLSW